MGVTYEGKDGFTKPDYIFSKGVAFRLGGGMDFWVSPFVTIGGRLLYQGLYFGNPDVETQVNDYSNFVSGISVDANLAIHF